MEEQTITTHEKMLLLCEQVIEEQRTIGLPFFILSGILREGIIAVLSIVEKISV